jgi:hypothetical protein
MMIRPPTNTATCVSSGSASSLSRTVVDKNAHRAKYGSRADPPEDLTYLLMLERFNYFLGRRNDVGVIVSDEQKGSEDAIRHAHSRYRKSGTGYALIDNVIETPSSLRRTGRACCRSRTWQRGW